MLSRVGGRVKSLSRLVVVDEELELVNLVGVGPAVVWVGLPRLAVVRLTSEVACNCRGVRQALSGAMVRPLMRSPFAAGAAAKTF